ncbi:MAG TPA: cation:proton antiporter regulatory subunit [Nocardioidaceae bacterium]|jgi:TrkA domain protein|nr:cation:proton antiporter regulatory subunit [Nocardioidaceae bacterium]
MDIVETLLPGVGIRYELTTETGVALAFVVQRGGSVEVAVYDREDRDRAQSVLTLSPAEAAAIADVLGAPRMTERFADLSREVPGLRSARFALRRESPYVDRPLGATQARTRTGCSIVAVVRGDQVVTSPGPAEMLHTGDVLVVIGSREGLEALGALLAGGED